IQLAGRAAQVTDGVPGWYVRWAGYVLTSTLVMAGGPAPPGQGCAPALTPSRRAGGVAAPRVPLSWVVVRGPSAGRAQDAAAHLREGLQISLRTGGRYELLTCLDGCGYLCAETGRPAEAVTIWAAFAVLVGHGGTVEHAPALARRRAEPLRAARQAL